MLTLFSAVDARFPHWVGLLSLSLCRDGASLVWVLQASVSQRSFVGAKAPVAVRASRAQMTTYVCTAVEGCPCEC